MQTTYIKRTESFSYRVLEKSKVDLHPLVWCVNYFIELQISCIWFILFRCCATLLITQKPKIVDQSNISYRFYYWDGRLHLLFWDAEKPLAHLNELGDWTHDWLQGRTINLSIELCCHQCQKMEYVMPKEQSFTGWNPTLQSGVWSFHEALTLNHLQD